MIEAVIDQINVQVTVPSFAQKSGLCEFTTMARSEGDMVFPVLYKGKDNLQFITTFDFRSGAFWHMKNGDTEIEKLDSPRVEYDYLQYTTPMRAYAIHRRSVIEDSAYGHEKLANNIIHAINESNVNSLKGVIGVNKVDIEVGNYSTDAEQIDQVFQNVDIKFKHDLTLVVVDYSIILQGYAQCFTNYTC